MHGRGMRKRWGLAGQAPPPGRFRRISSEMLDGLGENPDASLAELLSICLGIYKEMLYICKWECDVSAFVCILTKESENWHESWDWKLDCYIWISTDGAQVWQEVQRVRQATTASILVATYGLVVLDSLSASLHFNWIECSYHTLHTLKVSWKSMTI